MKSILIIFDIIILVCSYSGLYFIRYSEFIPQGSYLKLFVLLVLFWLLLSLYFKKYKVVFRQTLRVQWRALFWSASFTLFFTTLIVSITDLFIVSRIFLIGVVIVPFLLEIVSLSIISVFLRNRKNLELTVSKDKIHPNKGVIILGWLIPSAVMLFVTYLILVWLKTGNFTIYPRGERILLALYGSWGVSIFLTRKYTFLESRNILYQVAPFIKSGVIMLLLLGVIYFFLRIEEVSRYLLFGTALTFTFLETSFNTIYFISKKDHNNISDIGESIINQNHFGQKLLNHKKHQRTDIRSNITSLLDRVAFPHRKELVLFLEKHLQSQQFNHDKTCILSTTSIENIQLLENNSLNLFFNLHILNDVRRLNQYFIACYNKIISQGIIIGNFVPLEMNWQRLRSNMPKFMFALLYPLHFLFYRIFPKIPKICHLYFVLTNGKNRVLSKAEVFGRLSFCGFKVIAEQLLENRLYFIAKKLKTISTEERPSYGPLVHLKRIGLNGNVIIIHKFRTMHPYSEFIQADLYENHSLLDSGKFKDDFRLTKWGIFMRRYWIDELPQIYNWLRGDLKLFGVRALSEHYFSLYPEDLQKERIKHKPGLVPPYYVDLPKSFNEIIESERKYLKRKQKHPYTTDIIYFYKAFNNIVLRGVRSS